MLLTKEQEEQFRKAAEILARAHQQAEEAYDEQPEKFLLEVEPAWKKEAIKQFLIEQNDPS